LDAAYIVLDDTMGKQTRSMTPWKQPPRTGRVASDLWS
jgi:hypothetical protein